MKSIKRGRGPSLLGGVISICTGLFGVIWTAFTLKAGLGFFSLFGVVFIAIAIAQAVYNFRNATSENRYSEFEITENGEEPDPLNSKYGRKEEKNEKAGRFCPYCGAPVQSDFEFCRECGRKIPD